MELSKLVEILKRKLNVTWEDPLTDSKLHEIIEDAKLTMDHKLGYEIDYSKPGQERTLFANYCMYVWHDCSNEFDINYKNEINQIRKKYKVKRYVEKKNEV
ncbi:MAG: hypothetical protein RR460_04360 [Clostridium sp.]